MAQMSYTSVLERDNIRAPVEHHGKNGCVAVPAAFWGSPARVAQPGPEPSAIVGWAQNRAL